MAPDLNSVPLSPHGTFRSLQTSASSSRRASQLMGPPPAPATMPAAGGLAAARDSIVHPPHPSTSALTASADNTGVGMGPGSLYSPVSVYEMPRSLIRIDRQAHSVIQGH